MEEKKEDEKVKTFEDYRKAYRNASPRSVAVFEADMTEDQKRITFAMSDAARRAGNELRGLLKPRYEQLTRTKEYRKLQKRYGWHCRQMEGLDQESDEYKALEKEKKEIGKQMKEMQGQYGITWEDARHAMQYDIRGKYGLDSVFARSIAEDVWKGFESLLFGDGKNVHFKKRGDLPVLRANETNREIIFSVNEDGELRFSNKSIGEFGLLPVAGDTFLEDTYAAIMGYMYDKSMEKEMVELYIRTGEVHPVPRPCYASLKCEEIRGKLRVYVHITIADSAAPKRRKDGTPRHSLGKGKVGIDLGTQSCAAVSDHDVDLFNLAERDGHSSKEHEDRKRHLERAIEHSKMQTNPWRFNKNGTYKKGYRGKWVKSNHCLKMEAELRDLERKDAESRKYAVREDVNRMREIGDKCFIESPNAKKLQKRAKKLQREENPTTITKKDGTQKGVHKYKRRKRYGYSILHRCPGAYQADIKKKFGNGYHVVPQKYRASQYDHEADTYEKKELSQRWHELPDGNIIQRDVYSAWLLKNADYLCQAIDRDECLESFDEFLEMHGELIDRIVVENKKICNSGIKPSREKP